MSSFNLEIATDNAAYAEGNRPYEVARQLREIAAYVEEGYRSGKTLDINGNTTGNWHFVEESND